MQSDDAVTEPAVVGQVVHSDVLPAGETMPTSETGSRAAPLVRVHVRYFAAAKAAAGLAEQTRTVADGCSIEELLAGAGFAAVPVFARSSFLVNGVTTTHRSHPLHDGDELDVLPPFAGG
ncbi:MAG: Molybdenum cofactor biosynthesis protein MoaD [Subtercola sp.]|nr:Molybdenum cofactor biosynthesis protein MoaD [Subtercola sp.]